MLSIETLTQILIIVGAINWLGVGLTNTDYVTKFLSKYAKIIFVLVGVAGLHQLYLLTLPSNY
jgi:uncharacterized membrane protein YuzA (DUF378 family)